MTNFTPGDRKMPYCKGLEYDMVIQMIHLKQLQKIPQQKKIVVTLAVHNSFCNIQATLKNEFHPVC
jgi:hypothetical protein